LARFSHRQVHCEPKSPSAERIGQCHWQPHLAHQAGSHISDPELALLIDRWPTLSEDFRKRILDVLADCM